jgi:hypothetical protein
MNTIIRHSYCTKQSKKDIFIVVKGKTKKCFLLPTVERGIARMNRKHEGGISMNEVVLNNGVKMPQLGFGVFPGYGRQGL